MADVIDMSEWNATTGSFTKPPKVADRSAEQFAEMITQRLNAADLNPDQVGKTLQTLDNAAVYLHGADTTDRAARTATVDSIATEWVSLGLSGQEASFMLERSVGYTLELEGQDQDKEPQAEGMEL